MDEREKREARLAHFARKHLGKPYKYGARSWQAPKVFDCSSFVQYCYRRVDIELPRVAIAQAKIGTTVPKDRTALKIGDTIFLRGIQGRYNQQFSQGIGHVALYIGDGKVIHAEGVQFRCVVEQPLEAILDRSDIVVIKRYF